VAENQPEQPTTKRTVQFEYIKSGAFRVIHGDGVIGSISPGTDGIDMSVFSERLPIPLQTTYELTEKGTIGPEIRSERKSREGVVREVEVCVSMSIDVAMQVRDWLSGRIEQFQTLHAKLATGKVDALDTDEVDAV